MPFDDWKADATAEVKTVAVCFNRRLHNQWQEAVGRLDEAQRNGQDTQELAQLVVDLSEQVEADKRAHTFCFETVRYSTWRELVEEHEPTEKQRELDQYAEFNPDTFPPAAIAAACVDPELTEDDAVWLREHLPRVEFDRLFSAALTVSVGGGDLPKSVVAIARTLASGQKSITPAS